MPIQVERAQRAIRNVLGADLSQGLSFTEVAELAFNTLLSMREGWVWAQKTAYLNTVAGAKLINLPEDFGNLLNFELQDADMRILPDHDWLMLNSDHQAVCPSTPLARIIGDEGAYQLEFIDEFSSSKESAYYVRYEIAPMEVLDGTTELPLPRYMHQVYLQIVRDLARGWDEAGDYDVRQLIESTKRSVVYESAVNKDERMRPRGIQKASIANPQGTQVFPFNPIAPIRAVDGSLQYPDTL